MARLPAAAPEQLTEAEFAQWEPVADVVAFVREKQPFLYEETIKARVRSGALRIAVRRMVEMDDRGDPVRESRRRIITPAWIGKPDERFWDLGDHTVTVRRDSTGYSGSRVSAEVEACRFDPDAADQLRRDLGLPPKHVLPAPPPPVQISRAPPPIEPLGVATVSFGGVRRIDHFAEYRQAPERAPMDERTLRRIKGIADGLAQVGPTPPEPSPPPPRVRRSRTNPVTDREIKVWFKGLSAAQKTLGVVPLWELAQEQHPGRHLPRKMVEQFGKGRGTGHRSVKASSPKRDR